MGARRRGQGEKMSLIEEVKALEAKVEALIAEVTDEVKNVKTAQKAWFKRAKTLRAELTALYYKNNGADKGLEDEIMALHESVYNAESKIDPISTHTASTQPLQILPDSEVDPHPFL